MPLPRAWQLFWIIKRAGTYLRGLTQDKNEALNERMKYTETSCGGLDQE
jgi:hypothetical protein